METAETLREKSKAEIFDFIREKLKFNEDVISQLRYSLKDPSELDSLKREHRRFDMSGYDGNKNCTVFNTAILNEFAYLGIYDYTEYLFLDFYKGHCKLYLKYWVGEDENLVAIDDSGYGTTDIIYKIFELTIFSGRGTRRRN